MELVSPCAEIPEFEAINVLLSRTKKELRKQKDSVILCAYPGQTLDIPHPNTVPEERGDLEPDRGFLGTLVDRWRTPLTNRALLITC